MALTLSQARAQWIADNPFPVATQVNGQNHFTTQPEYDAMADDRAQMLVAQSVQADADTARTLLRKKYRTDKTTVAAVLAMPALPANLNNTQLVAAVRALDAQVRNLAQMNDGLLDILKDAGLLLDG